jgi:peptidoglycan/LPS O-acetylase OafA/YrhL
VIVGCLSAHIGFTPKPVSPEQIGWHLFYLQAWFDFEHIQVVYWTLCYEIQFYSGLLLLLWITRGTDRVKHLMAGTLMLSLLYRGWQPEAEAFMGNAWFCFALGVLAHWAVNRQGERLFLLLSGAVAVGGALRPDAYAVAGSATAFLLYLAIASGRAHIGSHPALQFLGRISYSLYLTHLIGGWVVLGVARHFMGDAAAVLVAVVASIASAWVFHVFVEAPAVKLSRRVSLSKSSREPVPA